MHLAEAFIQSDLHLHSSYSFTFLSDLNLHLILEFCYCGGLPKKYNLVVKFWCKLLVIYYCFSKAILLFFFF